MLTKEQCNEALEHIKTLRGSNYGGYYSGFNNSALPFDEDINVMQELMYEHFDNQPLEWEELKQGMWIWDNVRKEWVKVESQRETYTKIVECWVIGWALLKTYEFEPNRFYRKEVQE